MVIVADSSPLIVLINIGQIGILPALFGQAVIPPEVAQELRGPNRPDAVKQFAAAPPGWLVERAPASVEPIQGLHAGECAAISLARGCERTGATGLRSRDSCGRRWPAQEYGTALRIVLSLSARRVIPSLRSHRGGATGSSHRY